MCFTYDFNISLFNRLHDSNLDKDKDEKIFHLLNYDNFFDLTKKWIKKQGYTIITINDPKKSGVSISLNKKDSKQFDVFMCNEHQAIFNISSELFNYIEEGK